MKQATNYYIDVEGDTTRIVFKLDDGSEQLVVMPTTEAEKLVEQLKEVVSHG